MPSPIGVSVGGSVAGIAWPVASASARRAGARMSRPRVAGPTRSPSTAPASTDDSCSGSPTRISRPSGRTASTRRAMSDSDTIERLVDDDHVVGEPVEPVVAEPGVIRAPAQQTVQRLAPEAEEPVPLLRRDRKASPLPL